MRPGIFVSLVGHVGAVLMTLLAWETRGALPSEGVTIVPVEIVDIALESNVRALAEDIPDEEEAAPAAEEIAANEPPPPTPTPRPAQTPPRRQNDDFNLGDIASNLGNLEPNRRRRDEGAPSSRTQSGAGPGTAEWASLESRAAALVDRALRACWRSTEDMSEPERLLVTVSFQLNRNGSLNGQPVVVSPRNTTFDPQMAEAVRRAIAAVRICDQRQSFARIAEDPVVGEHYEVWRSQEITFGPQRR